MRARIVWWIALGFAAAVLGCATMVLRLAARRIESEIALSESDIGLFRHGSLRLPAPNPSSDGVVLDAVLGRLPFAQADYALVTEDTFEAGVAAMKRAPEIKELHVMFARIDRTKAEKLSELRHLRVLRFAGSSISDDLLATIQQKLPNCKVEGPRVTQPVPPELRAELDDFARSIRW